MPSTYSTNLKIELMSTGENSGTWGTVTNTNLGTALEQAVVGYGNPNYSSDADLTITLTDSNAAQAARALVLNVTSGVSLSATRELIVPTIQKQYIVQNNTTGSQSITVKTSSGTGITVPNGRKAHLYVDGTNVIQMFDFVDINGGAIDGTTVGAASASTGAFTTLTASGATTLNGAVALGDAAADLITVPGTINSNVIFTDNTYDIGASGATRPRTIYAATSIFAPLMDATNLEVTNIKANDGTAAASIANSTGAITVSTLLNVDNLRLDGNTLSSTDSNGNVVLAPNGTGDVQLDADTVRIGDSNANATITTNGTGDLILNTNAGTNSGSITIEDGVNGNIIIAPNGTGQVQISNAALDLTTIEVTNIKAKDGTASMTLADTTGIITLSATAGTANGVLYLNGSRAVTSGSALTFDGSVLSIAAASPEVKIGRSASNQPKLSFGSTTATDFYLQASSATGILRYDAGPSVAWGGVHSFYTDTAERLRITSGGQVNIGGNFTSTNNTLQVTGNAAIGYTTAAPTTGLIVAGNVGIGTDAPQTQVHISGAGSQTLALERTGAVVSGRFEIISGNNTNLLRAVTAKPLVFEQGTGVPVMYLDTSGNLGLGVTPNVWGTGSSVRALQLTQGAVWGFGAANMYLGANNFFNGTDRVYLSNNTAGEYRITGNVHAWMQTAIGTANTTTITNGVSYTIITSGNQTAFGAANNNVGTSFTANASGTLSSGTVSQNISFTQAMTLDASGNLGVGTTSPGSRLEVRASAGEIARFTTADGYRLHVYANSTGNAGAGIQAQNTDLRLSAFDAATNIRFFTGNGSTETERMRLDSSGNLGLGVTPSAWRTSEFKAVQVGNGASFYGRVTAGDEDKAGFSANAFFDQTDNRWEYIATDSASRYDQIGGGHYWFTAASGTAGNQISFGDAKMTLDASGNLGIGLTNPTARSGGGGGVVDANGPVLARGALNVDQTNAGVLQYASNETRIRSYGATAGTGFMTFTTGGGGGSGDAERARITSGGQFAMTNDGTNAAPAISFTNDLDTGIFRPTTNQLGFATAGVQAMTLDASGRLGIGITNPSYTQQIQSSTTSSGATPAFNLVINRQNSSTEGLFLGMDGNTDAVIAANNSALRFGIVVTGAYSERARITSGGDFVVSSTGTPLTTGTKLTVSGSHTDWIAGVTNTNASPRGLFVGHNTDSNGTANWFLYCEAGGSTQRMSVRSNGGIANYSANDVNLASDRRLKNTIEPMRSYYDVFKNLNWVTWLYNDQTDDLKNHGVIAQELQTLAPEFVCESNAKETQEGEAPYLGIWEQDFKMAGMSVITELIKKIEKLEAEVAALKGA